MKQRNMTAKEIALEYKTNYEIMCAVYAKLNAKYPYANFAKVIDVLCKWYTLSVLWSDIQMAKERWGM